MLLYFWVLCVIIGVIILFCNGVVIFIMFWCERFYRNFLNWFLLFLVFLDLLVGIIMIFLLFICYFFNVVCSWGVNKKVYDLFFYIFVINFCFLILDRYFVVVFFLKYVIFFFVKLIIKLLVFVWLFFVFMFLIFFILEFFLIMKIRR